MLFNYAYRKTKWVYYQLQSAHTNHSYCIRAWFTFRIVRLTSPNLNYLIIIGCLFIYISVYWYLIPSTNTDVVLTSCCVSGLPFVFSHVYTVCHIFSFKLGFWEVAIFYSWVPLLPNSKLHSTKNGINF